MLSYLSGRRATEPVPSSDSPEGTAANGSNSDDEDRRGATDCDRVPDTLSDKAADCDSADTLPIITPSTATEQPSHSNMGDATDAPRLHSKLSGRSERSISEGSDVRGRHNRRSARMTPCTSLEDVVSAATLHVCRSS